MRQHILLLGILAGSLLVLSACRGTVEVGVERTPTSDRRAEATITALGAENARLAAALAARATATPAPPANLGRVAYVQGGDIWTRALPNEKPVRLTTDGRNHAPRWSPTGHWLAFRRERPLTVQRQVACDIPRPRQELCTESVLVMQNQVWVTEEGGAGARALNSNLSIDRFAWSPDGRWIAYEWLDPNAGPSAVGSLRQVSLDGKTRQIYAVPAPGENAVILAGWSSLSQYVLFWASPVPPVGGSTQLYRIAASPNLGTAEPLQLTGEPTWPLADFYAPAPPGTRDGMSETLAIVVGAGRGTWSNKRIDLTGKLSSQEYAAISPAWSPDGTQLAFAALPERRDLGEPLALDLQPRHIWVADTNALSGAQMLTRDRAFRDEHPLWSADGKHILFARMDTRGRASLWAVPVENGRAWQVVDELTPAPDPVGTYGYIDWDELFDWWRSEER